MVVVVVVDESVKHSRGEERGRRGRDEKRREIPFVAKNPPSLNYTEHIYEEWEAVVSSLFSPLLDMTCGGGCRFMPTPHMFLLQYHLS